MLLGTFLSEWLELYVAPVGLAPRTVEMYRRCAASVPRSLAAMELRDVSPLHVQRWLVRVASSHPRTAQQCRVTIMRAINLARKMGLTDCVLDKDSCPRIHHKAAKRNILSPDQARAYVRAASADRYGLLLLLCLCCGLRRGEALGARWKDIDADGVLHVCGQRQRVNGKLVRRQLKSDAADRRLVLPPWLLQEIRSSPRRISGYLVDVTPEGLNKAHHRVMASIGVQDVTIHGLRHTFATYAAQGGMPMKTLQLQLGHAEYALTADLYADHAPEMLVLPALFTS